MREKREKEGGSEGARVGDMNSETVNWDFSESVKNVFAAVS